MKIPIDKIIIGARQRIDLGDIADLAESIRELGQINPITVEPVLNGLYNLLAGRRRLAAATLLGWPTIEATTQSGISEVTKQRIEYEEDIKRKDRSWQEKCIAISKLNFLMEREKAADGESWTSKNMASFTGIGRSSIKYMLQVAEYLEAKPRDEDVWNAENYVEAIKVIVSRNTKAAQAELEVRRQRNMVVPSNYVIAIDLAYGDDETVVAEDGLIIDSASSKPQESKTILIHGINLAFEDAVPDEHFAKESYFSVLAYNPKEAMAKNIHASLRETGTLVIWFDTVFEQDDLDEMLTIGYGPGYPLIWNKINFDKVTPWPFGLSFSHGFFQTMSCEPGSVHPNPSGSVISCHQDDPLNLPFGVVDYTLEACCPPNVAVLLPCNAPVVAVAQTGRVPVFFEADKGIFDAKVRELTAWYESNIPRCVVKLKGT